jgi:DNA invertase Pin-like site-specific DNA recombinase
VIRTVSGLGIIVSRLICSLTLLFMPEALNSVSHKELLDATGPFKDVMISMFATLARQERARISERTIAGLKVARAKGKRLGRPPVPAETIHTVLTLRQENGIGARRIAKSTGFPLGTVSAILSRSRTTNPNPI